MAADFFSTLTKIPLIPLITTLFYPILAEDGFGFMRFAGGGRRFL
jgi:hypothetical protein